MAEQNSKRTSTLVTKYVAFIMLFTAAIFLFSLIMAGVASYRNDISYDNYLNTSKVYNGPLEQSAPNLGTLDRDSVYYKTNTFAPELLKSYVDNTALTATNANVTIDADFVKKGLALQPTYRTKFNAVYTLENKLDKESFITFAFPLPVNGETNEISNARLIVNGEEIEGAKTKINTSDQYGYPYSADGLKWSGKIAAKSEIDIEVSYNTVGLSLFTYKGIENSKGAQDFNFAVQINGTRSYNVVEGLSVDKREFGDNYVKLSWNKESLFSKPLINVEVGEKLNPSIQVSRVYLTMSPIYVVFISILVFLSFRFGRALRLFDLFLISVLFVVYFPLIHYLSSFTIDPTMELFAGIANVTEFSMPLYGAFVIAFGIVAGLMLYLIGKMASFRFAIRLGIPTLLLFLGFFPLVVTIPEYSMLLVLLGTIALIAIAVQVRIKLNNRIN